MTEFKTLSFVIIGSDGKTHRIAVDKMEGEAPSVESRGDLALLERRLHMMLAIINDHLRQQNSE
jgi:hypothetical protein